MRTEPTPMVTYRLHTRRQFSLYVEEDIELQAHVLKTSEAHQKLLTLLKEHNEQKEAVRQLCIEFRRKIKSTSCCVTDNGDLATLIRSIEAIFKLQRGLSLLAGGSSGS